MKFKSIKILSVLLALGFTGSASAIGQQGDTRLQVNGSFTFADEGDDTLLTSLQYQRYTSDSLLLGGVFTLSDTGGNSTTNFGATIKKSFPSGSDTVPYIGAAALLLSSDSLDDDEFVFSVSGGADLYVAENFGFNFDATQGLTSDFYEDLILSFGAFYEF
jgi:hypothetical protein